MPVQSSTLVAFLGLWFVASSLWGYPHSLSYFNESIGGPLNGPKHLLGSNVDWGQDLRYLLFWVKDMEAGRDQLSLAYYGRVDPSSLGFNFGHAVSAKPGNSDAVLRDGIYCLSVNLICGLDYPARSGRAIPQSLDAATLCFFRNRRPNANAGHSILIFQVHQ